MTDLNCTVEEPQLHDSTCNEWISKIRYSDRPRVFALTDIDLNLAIDGTHMKCSKMSFQEPFTRIKKELASQISDHSLDWFQQYCDEQTIYDVLELQDVIHIDPSIVCIPEDAMYDRTHFENTVPSKTFLEHISNVHKIFCMIQSILYRDTHIFLQIGVSHVRMKTKIGHPSVMDSEDCSTFPEPSREEITMIDKQIQKALNQKGHKLNELVAIEKFLQTEFKEKMKRLQKEKNSVSMEIDCLRKTH